MAFRYLNGYYMVIVYISGSFPELVNSFFLRKQFRALICLLERKRLSCGSLHLLA